MLKILSALSAVAEAALELAASLRATAKSVSEANGLLRQNLALDDAPALPAPEEKKGRKSAA